MKSRIVIVCAMLALALSALAEERPVFMEFFLKTNPGPQTQVNRVPPKNSIGVFYDSDSHILSINGDEALNAEVYLYNQNGSLVDYSSSINVFFKIPSSGIYRLSINGDGWHAEGYVEIE